MMGGYGLLGGVRGNGLMLGSGSDKACREGDTLVLCSIGVCGGVNSSFDSYPLLAVFWLLSDFDLGLPFKVAGSTMNDTWAEVPKPDLVNRKVASLLLELFEFRFSACPLPVSISDNRFDIIKTEASLEAEGGMVVNLVLSINNCAFAGAFWGMLDKNGRTVTKNLFILSYKTKHIAILINKFH